MKLLFVPIGTLAFILLLTERDQILGVMLFKQNETCEHNINNNHLWEMKQEKTHRTVKKKGQNLGEVKETCIYFFAQHSHLCAPKN